MRAANDQQQQAQGFVQCYDFHRNDFRLETCEFLDNQSNELPAN